MTMKTQGITNYVAIYLPSIGKDNRPTCQSYYTDKTCKEFATLFGGYTVTKCIGGYVDSKGKLIEESVNVIKSFMPQFDKAQELKLFRIAQSLKETMNQESIALEINGALFLL